MPTNYIKEHEEMFVIGCQIENLAFFVGEGEGSVTGTITHAQRYRDKEAAIARAKEPFTQGFRKMISNAPLLVYRVQCEIVAVAEVERDLTRQEDGSWTPKYPKV